MKHITFTYRNNPGHETIIPPLIERLQENGYTVDSIVFPAGTDPSEIQRDMMGRDLCDTIVVADETVRGSAGLQGGDTLDNLYQVVTADLLKETYGVDTQRVPQYDHLMGLDLDSKVDWLERTCEALTSYGKTATALHKEAFKDAEPDSIYIIKENLTDHTPFSDAYGREFGGRAIETGLTNVNPFFAKSINYSRSKEGKEELPIDRRPEDWIESWIVDAGYDSEKIHIVQSPSDLPENLEGAWVVADSHKHLSKNPEIAPRLFEYPLTYGIQTLTRTGHMQGIVDIERVGKEVYEILVNKF